MSLAPGMRLGPYAIVGPLGAGGMGEVYRARDTKLGRDVAIKVLPAAFAQDAERVARFRREAHVLASLNHPNIAAIHGLEESEGVLALALELVEGEDLALRLKRGPIPVDFAERHAGPEDVLIVVEVADSSLGYDRGAKLRVYASAGVPVYIIVNIPERQVECYEEPVAGQGRYQRRTDYRPGETLLLPLVGGRTLPMAVDDAFGPASR